MIQQYTFLTSCILKNCFFPNVFTTHKFGNVCKPAATSSNILWKQQLLIFFLITVCMAALLQCLTGSDVLKWRSFYATQDDAWKAHYREVFDNGIREALCCMGRVKYLQVLQFDQHRTYTDTNTTLMFVSTTSIMPFYLYLLSYLIYTGVYWKKMRFSQQLDYWVTLLPIVQQAKDIWNLWQVHFELVELHFAKCLHFIHFLIGPSFTFCHVSTVDSC